jgi:FdhD protein
MIVLPQPARYPIDPALPVEVVSAHAAGREIAGVSVADERPIAFAYNGFSHAVMMASPIDLEDFVYGFSLTEGIIEHGEDIHAIAVTEQDEGTRIEVSLTGSSLHRYLARRRVRRLSGNTSCGLCGVEDFADAAPRAGRVPAASPIDPELICRTADQLRQCQPLSRVTRGAHAAAWVSRDGRVEVVREDVGRHNALDKLIGALLRGQASPRDGFCLITSRCSFEMVQKAAAAGFSTLVSISSPTSLAIRMALAAGMTLFALSQDGTPLLFASRDRQ